MKSFTCGTIIKTYVGNIEGMITCISIRFEKITYEISYFYNGEQKVIWMNENEFSAGKVNSKQEIGF